jgi:hypothetical protein
MVWVLGFAQQQWGKWSGRHTWWELAAGEEPDEDLSPWRRAAAAEAVPHSSARRREREREKESARGGGGGGGNTAIAQSEPFGGRGGAQPHGLF